MYDSPLFGFFIFFLICSHRMIRQARYISPSGTHLEATTGISASSCGISRRLSALFYANESHSTKRVDLKSLTLLTVSVPSVMRAPHVISQPLNLSLRNNCV